MEEASPKKGGVSSPSKGSNRDADPKGSAIESVKDPSGLKREDNRSFTMRELLNELKEDGDGSAAEANANEDGQSFRFVSFLDHCGSLLQLEIVVLDIFCRNFQLNFDSGGKFE